MDSTSKVDELRSNFLATSTQSMPIAGMTSWTVIAVASLTVTPLQLGYMVGFGSGMIFRLAY